ncbi:hypothetical protein INT43_000392 [Umbelopsis isabellina]|uniref:Uncharacterized protein n=1 Tax=Mortierella isabellina TaxID=91625 RepID=A0A8H7Q374_MORIS|nr:hypothetical protein INT43_000392 [Umbelopsis isabellina]
MSTRHSSGLHKRTPSQAKYSIEESTYIDKPTTAIPATKATRTKNLWLFAVFSVVAIYILYKYSFQHDLISGTDDKRRESLLTQALLEDSMESDGQAKPSWMDDMGYRNKLEYPQALQRDPKVGHSMIEIQRLESNGRLQYTNSLHRIVSVTAILAIDNSIDVRSQVAAVLSQTVRPAHIWLIIDKDVHLPIAVSREKLPEYVGFRVFVREKAADRTWLSIANMATTRHTWFLTNGVRPGVKYLQRLLRLSQTQEYTHALLGTEGVILPLAENTTLADADDMVCLPQAIETGELPNQSAAVDMLADIWLLRREWIPIIMSYTTPELLQIPIGFRISLTLSKAGITTIALPINPVDQGYWGDIREHTRTLHNEGSLSCRQRKEEYSFNSAWQRILDRNQYTLVAEIRELTYQARAQTDIIFIISTAEELQALSPIMCSFIQQGKLVHLINSGTQSLYDMQPQQTLYGHNGCKANHVHDLSIDTKYWTEEDIVFAGTHQIAEIHDLLHILDARLVIYAKEHAIWQDVIHPDIGIKSVLIGLPTADLAHIGWLATLSLETLQEWNTVDINLFVVTDSRPDALSRLLRSMNSAHYLGDTVKLTMNTAHTADKVTQVLVKNFLWGHGQKIVRHRIRRAGFMKALVESWYPSSVHEYAIFLDDDLELSPYFYIWAKFTVLKYRYSEHQDTLKNMFGISLYSPPGLDLHPDGLKPFIPSELLDPDLYPMETPYLLQLPSTWGALYFPEHWMEFHDYITGRLTDDHGKKRQDIQIPESRSNEWRFSPRRYMIEMIYLRGYSMLYPNFNNYTSFSTVQWDAPPHLMIEQNETYHAQVPLMDKNTILDGLSGNALPDWHDLPIFDYLGMPTSVVELQEKGRILQRDVSACDPGVAGTSRFDPSDLLCPFPIILLEEEEPKNKTTEETNVKYVTIYVVGPAPTIEVEDSNIDHWQGQDLPNDPLNNHYEEQAFEELTRNMESQLQMDGNDEAIDDESQEQAAADTPDGTVQSQTVRDDPHEAVNAADTDNQNPDWTEDTTVEAELKIEADVI